MTKTRSFIQTTMKNLFASIPLSLFLIVIYGLAIGWATFIEKDYGTLVANDVIYHSWWFEVLNVWLLLNILGCMYKSAKISFKISVQIFHLALVMIIIGAAITRYYGFEGNMVLKNGETVHIYPEGMLRPYATDLLQFKKGAFAMAVENNVPIIPSVILTREPDGIYKWFKRKPLFTQVVLEPIYPDITIENKGERIKKMLDEAYTKMKEQLDNNNEITYEQEEVKA